MWPTEAVSASDQAGLALKKATDVVILKFGNTQAGTPSHHHHQRSLSLSCSRILLSILGSPQPCLSHYSRLPELYQSGSVSLTGNRIIHTHPLAECAKHAKDSRPSHSNFSAASSHLSSRGPQSTHTSPSRPPTSTISNPPDFPSSIDLYSEEAAVPFMSHYNRG